MMSAKESAVFLLALLAFVAWCALWPALGALNVARLADRIEAQRTEARAHE